MTIFIRLALLLALLASSAVKADCGQASGASPVHWDAIDLGTIQVQRDTPVGKMIYSRQLSSSQNGKNYVFCQPGTALISASTPRTASGVLANVYSTGIPGVGIKMYETKYETSTFDNPARTGTFNGSLGTNIEMGPGVTIEIYKTGPITSGAFATGKYFSKKYGSYESIWGNITGGYVQQLACSLNQTTVNVKLGDWMTTSFTGPGAATTPQPVNIGLNCDSGTRVNVNLQGTADTRQPGTLKLTPEANVADGVGVQILNQNNQPVTLNSKSLLTTTSTSGNYIINWQARYIQTAATVTSGPANAQATLTITYE